MRATHLSIIAATALSLGLAPVAYASKTVHVSCGQTITKDTRLANDLTDCPNNGLVIGADDITLDLNGHTIDGDGAVDAYDLGIDNTAGHDGVTIQHGAVREFVEGVLVAGAAENRVRNLVTSHQFHGGITLSLSTGIRVESNSSVTDCAGVIVLDSHNVRVERNSVSDHTCAGVSVFGSSRVDIAGNTVAGGSGDPAGIGLFDHSNHNQVERNSVSGNGFVGVIVEESDDNDVAGNHIFRNRDAVILQGNGNTLRRNRVEDALGADDGSGFGIVLEGGEDNLITANAIERTASAGIWVDVPELDLPTVGNILRLNQVNEAGTDGISVGSTAADTRLERNSADGAGDDGFDVESASTTLIRNTANHNDDLGIEAVTGVTDGGGNRASGNGNPLQCTNVFCR
jgi:parallel beta-helix repeat protein